MSFEGETAGDAPHTKNVDLACSSAWHSDSLYPHCLGYPCRIRISEDICIRNWACVTLAVCSENGVPCPAWGLRRAAWG